MFEFRLKFHWSLFPRVQLTIFHHWFRWWLGADQATSHYLNQCWFDYRRICASLGLNELSYSRRIRCHFTSWDSFVYKVCSNFSLWTSNIFFPGNEWKHINIFHGTLTNETIPCFLIHSQHIFSERKSILVQNIPVYFLGSNLKSVSTGLCIGSELNLSAPGRCSCNLKSVFFKIIS